jgi:hypothetical protein
MSRLSRGLPSIGVVIACVVLQDDHLAVADVEIKPRQS